MIGNTLNRIKEYLRNRPQQEYTDDETRDKYLRSLRRERRMQMEKEEKKRLIKQIQQYKDNETKKHLFGIGGDSILNEKKQYIKKTPPRTAYFNKNSSLLVQKVQRKKQKF